MKLYVFEVLEKIAKARTKKEKVEILQQNNSGALRDICRGTFDDSIVWLLPEGEPPYTANKPESTPSDLHRECRMFAYLVKGGKGPDLNQIRREKIFIGILESIHPEDANVVVGMINKKPPKGLTRSVVEEAFPNLLLK